MKYRRSHKFLEKIALVIALSLAACAHQESFEEGGLGEFAAVEGEMGEMAALPSEQGSDFLIEPPLDGEMASAEALPQDLELGDFSDPLLGAEPLPEQAAPMVQDDLSAMPAEGDMALGAPIDGGVGVGVEPAMDPAAQMMPPIEPMVDAQPEPMVAPMDMQAGPELMAATEPAMDSQPVVAAAEPEYSPAPKPRKRLKAPVIAEKPFVSHGDTLNRYYFVREGDTQDSVAELLFGDPSLTSQLTRWNPAASWKAGSLLYYSSPDQKDDPRMKGFHEERGIVAGEYQVQPGDTLAAIAEQQYGNGDSWKEIAVVNGIKTPANLDAGATLALLPQSLNDYARPAETKTAAVGAPAPEMDKEEPAPIDREITQLESQISSMEKEIDDIAAARAPAIGDVAIAPEPPPTQAELQKQKKLASVEVNGFVRQNLALILIIAGLGTFLLFYFFVKKSRDLGGDF